MFRHRFSLKAREAGLVILNIYEMQATHRDDFWLFAIRIFFVLPPYLE